MQQFGWLNEHQFLDAVAVAMITPGPVVITVAFIGYLVADLAGAVMASIGIFLPVYIFTIVRHPGLNVIATTLSLKPSSTEFPLLRPRDLGRSNCVGRASNHRSADSSNRAHQPRRFMALQNLGTDSAHHVRLAWIDTLAPGAGRVIANV